jgi:peptidoglycan/xylan/chitin deacetylase (PgdA/CDA1 family)
MLQRKVKLKIPGLKRSKLFVRWLRSRNKAGALILGYHRISNNPEDPFSICVSPDHFAQQLEILHKKAIVISLNDFVSRIREKRLPRRTVVLTFDDGYADFFYTAKPLLDQFQMPATVFISAGSLGDTPWWDELGTLIMSPEQLPRSLRLFTGGKHCEWQIQGEVKDGNSEANRSSRLHLLEELYHVLVHLSFEEQKRIIANIRGWIGSNPYDHKMPRLLTEEEVRELAKRNLLEIGSHSVSHLLLADHPVEMQHFEINHSRSILEKITGKNVLSFSYPHGSLLDVTKSMVKQAGYICACSSHNDFAWRESQRFNLPRFWIQDWDGKTFSKWLRLWI